MNNSEAMTIQTKVRSTEEALKALVHEMEYVLSCINADKVPFDGDDFHEALRLGKEALAQPEQCKYGQEPKSCTSSPMDCQCAIDATLAQPEQEPSLVTAARKVLDEFGTSSEGLQELYQALELYTTPPQPQNEVRGNLPRKPLTLEQLRKHWQVAKVLDMTDAEIDFADYVLITRDVEALHGIKE